MTNPLITEKNVLIMGGGRWARVIIQVILDLLPVTSKVLIFSLKNSQSMSEWTVDRKMEARTQVVNDLAKVESKNIKAVIVANAASDHEKSTEWAIQNKLPVLVEKPITLSANATKRLMLLADKENTIYAAAHVFRFARYLENFGVILKGETIKRIQIQWMDLKAEMRHGERKSYDPSLPIHKDVLPHLFSILATLNLPLPEKIKEINWNEKKTEIEIHCLSFDMDYKFLLTRDGFERQRIIQVETNTHTLKLDFSKEPGFIMNGESKVTADRDWDTKMRPLATMLSTFLNSISLGKLDSRFHTSFALTVNEFADSIDTFSN